MDGFYTLKIIIMIKVTKPNLLTIMRLSEMWTELFEAHTETQTFALALLHSNDFV